jgi:hypothetical protein
VPVIELADPLDRFVLATAAQLLGGKLVGRHRRVGAGGPDELGGVRAAVPLRGCAAPTKSR